MAAILDWGQDLEAAQRKAGGANSLRYFLNTVYRGTPISGGPVFGEQTKGCCLEQRLAMIELTLLPRSWYRIGSYDAEVRRT
jgi:hypothetical protein